MLTSRQNDQVKKWIKLKKKKERQKTNTFLIEGYHLIEEAIKSGMEVIELIISELVVDSLSDDLKHYQYTIVTEEISNEIADTETTQGIFAVVKMPQPTQQKGSKILLLDEVQDPGNVGTMIRSADAAGFTKVVLGKGTVDAYNQKVLRSAQGSHFHLTVETANLEDLIPELKNQGITVYGTDLSINSKNYKTMKSRNNIALIVGNEGSGVKSSVLDLVDETLHIPIKGQAESLNVAIAASILMFHLSD